jgi:hypothetical protein
LFSNRLGCAFVLIILLLGTSVLTIGVSSESPDLIVFTTCYNVS